MGYRPTSPELIIEEQCWLSAELTTIKTSCLHSKGVVVARLQVGDSKVVVAGISKVGGYIIRAVVHVNVIALGRQKEVLNNIPNPKTFAGFVGVKSLTMQRNC